MCVCVCVCVCVCAVSACVRACARACVLKLVSKLCHCVLVLCVSESALKGVAFHARCACSLTSKSTLIFGSVRNNEGNGYDGNTGIFTAPVPGVYMFLVSVRNVSSKSGSNVSLVVQGSEQVATEGSGVRTAHTVVKLKKGEQVWVSTKETYFSCEFSTSFFTGALIQAEVP